MARLRPDGELDLTPLTMTRRVALGAVGVGFALSTRPVAATTIITDTKGLVAGDVKIKVADGQSPAYFARPDGNGPYPAVLVVSEVFGLHEHIRDLEGLSVRPESARHLETHKDRSAISSVPLSVAGLIHSAIASIKSPCEAEGLRARALLLERRRTAGCSEKPSDSIQISTLLSPIRRNIPAPARRTAYLPRAILAGLWLQLFFVVACDIPSIGKSAGDAKC